MSNTGHPAVTTRARLTPAQRTLYHSLLRRAARALTLGVPVPAYTARRLERQRYETPRLHAVGSPQTLARLALKGYLTVVVDDYTNPIYALTPGWASDAQALGL